MEEQGKPGRFRRVIRFIAKLILVVVVAIILFGAIYQWAESRLSERRFPPPGKLYDVGGYRMHLNCTGQGQPTIVLDAGLGGGSIDWGTVQPELSRFTRVCSFDHAGAGWSDPGPQPRDGAQKVRELHSLLIAANITGPYVMAGHSLGGLTTQLYASEFPGDVAGVVLVDSSHELQNKRKEIGGLPAWALKTLRVLTPVGGTRMLLVLSSKGLHIPEASAEMRLGVYSRSNHLNSVIDEAENLDALMDQVHAKPMQLGTKPLIVLTRGKLSKAPWQSEEEAQAMESAWQELQKDLASRSTDSKQIIARNSTHFIQTDEPQVVIDALSGMIAKLRGGK